MYLNVNAKSFGDIPSVPALLSLSEMMFQKKPDISSVFLNYATKLIQNQFARAGSTPDRDAAFATLQAQAQQMKLPPPKTVESFANSLVASASGQYANDFYQIAYLAYASLSIYGPLSNSIQSRIVNVLGRIQNLPSQQLGTSSTPQFNSNQAPNSGGPPVFTPYGSPPVFTPQTGPSTVTSQGGPPVFTPAGGPPAFTPQGGPPSFTPQGGPPVFTPAGGPPSFTPQGGPPNFNPSAGYSPNQSSISDKARQLMELADKAFKAGSMAIAYSALNGAISELQK